MAKRKCKHCSEYVDAESGIKTPVAFFCCHAHAIEYASVKAQAARERQQARTARDIKSKQKAVRDAHRKRKEEIKPLSKLKSEAQAVVNRYVRLRDAGLGCVSCDKPASWGGQWHASHFHPRGRSSKLRFNLLNIHKSCSVCNSHLSGNLLNYQPELIRRIGQERFDWLESVANEETKYSAEYLRRLKRVFAKRCRILEKRILSATKSFCADRV